MEEKINYDNIPVEYCRNAACHSLAIVEEDGLIFCLECGCTKTDTDHLSVWEEYYQQAHGKKFLDD